MYQFWRGLHKVKHKFSWGAQFVVQNGRNTLFWDDTWISDVPLRLLFPRVFNLCRDKSATVNQCFADGEVSLNFRRTFTQSDFEEWEKLLDLLQNVSLNEAEDKVKWALEKSNTYSTKSMYIFLTFRGVVNKRLQQLWKSRLLMKLKVFMWLTMQGRLQTGMALKEKKMER